MQYNNTKQKPIRNTSYQGSTKYSILNTKIPNCTARPNEISRANKQPNTSYTDAFSFSFSVSSFRNTPWFFFSHENVNIQVYLWYGYGIFPSLFGILIIFFPNHLFFVQYYHGFIHRNPDAYIFEHFFILIHEPC